MKSGSKTGFGWLYIYIALSWTEELILVAVKTIFKTDKDLPIQSTATSAMNFKASYCFTPQREAEIMPPSFIFLFFFWEGGREEGVAREGLGGNGRRGKNRFSCRKVCRVIWMAELN